MKLKLKDSPLGSKRWTYEAVQYRVGEQDGCFADDVIAGDVRYPEDGTMLVRSEFGSRAARNGDYVVRSPTGVLYVFSAESLLSIFDYA